MADIAFLLLIFFLVATTVGVDTGLSRVLPPLPDDGAVQESIEVKQRNMLAVRINFKDQLLVAGEPMPVHLLKSKVKEFITNPSNSPHLPEMKEVNIPLLGLRRVSRGVISLQNDNGTTYRMYMQVQNELVAAYNELRDELAREVFRKSYTKLTRVELDAVGRAIPQRISEAEPQNIGKK